MTVFKGFLTITKRNLGYVLMYIIIFLTITIAVQKSELTDTDKMFEQTKTRHLQSLTMTKVRCPKP